MQHARFIEYASALNIEFDNGNDVQSNFDYMYGVMVKLLNGFYPQREITVTSSNPPAANHACLESLLCLAKWLGYCRNKVLAVADLFDSADDYFFHSWS